MMVELKGDESVAMSVAGKAACWDVKKVVWMVAEMAGLMVTWKVE